MSCEPAVTLPAAVEARIIAHARQAAPAECCGLLLGTPLAIHEARPAPNAADDVVRQYRIDPREHLEAIREARRRAWDVIGAYHSHPRTAALPSPTDAREAFGGFVFVIVGFEAGRPDVRAWRWQEGNFASVPLVRVE